MKKTALVAVALTFGLSGCAHHHMRTESKPDPFNPHVSVVDGKYIVVNQEPIIIPRKDKDKTITWHLPKDTPYSFPADGIVIDKGDDEFKCNVEADKKKFACKNKNSKPGKYKYTIKVMDGAKPLEPLDPIILND